MISSPSKILIVDDLEANRNELKRLMESLEVDIFEAASCAEALHQILKQPFELILMDVRMPKVDGFDTAEIIGNFQKTNKTPIVFLTTDNNPISVQKGYSLGGVDYITRPYNKTEFLEKIQTFLQFYKDKK